MSRQNFQINKIGEVKVVITTDLSEIQNIVREILTTYTLRAGKLKEMGMLLNSCEPPKL